LPHVLVHSVLVKGTQKGSRTMNKLHRKNLSISQIKKTREVLARHHQ